MATKEALLCCHTYPTFKIGVEGQVRLLFGLPAIHFDSSCEGIHVSLASLNVSLSAFFPLLRVCDCILKLIKAVQAIPDALGPPPDPSKITDAVEDLADCFSLMTSFTFPLILPDFCRFIKDLVRFIIAVLTCIRSSLTFYLDSKEEEVALAGSTDPSLQEMGACLVSQNGSLKAAIDAKLDGMKLLITAINTVLGIFAIAGVSSLPTNPSEVTPAALDGMLATLNTTLDVLEGVCPG